MVVLLGGRVTEHLVFGAGDHRRLGRPAQGARDQPLDGHPVRHGHRARSRSSCPPTTTRCPTTPAGMVDEEQQYLTDLAHRRALKLVAREPHAARGVRLHAARERGARARGHRRDLAAYRRERGAATREPLPGARPSGRRAGRPDPAAEREPSSTPAARLRAPCSARIDHIGVAVDGPRRRRGALPRTGSACRSQHRETVEQFGVEAVLLGIGDAHVELLSPTDPDSAGRPLPRAQRPRPAPRGLPDRRHRRRARAAARRPGLRLIDEEPRTGIRNSRVAFVHPKSTGGVLTELVQPAEEH